jgi:plasmid maintenance system antidote protein VapI
MSAAAVAARRAAVTAERSLKLGAAFRASPGFWRNAQKSVGLDRALQRAPMLPDPLVAARSRDWRWRT